MSGEVVDFGFVSKEEAQVKRYKKPLKDAAMKEKKEREAMEKWNKELAEIEEGSLWLKVWSLWWRLRWRCLSWGWCLLLRRRRRGSVCLWCRLG